MLDSVDRDVWGGGVILVEYWLYDFLIVYGWKKKDNRGLFFLILGWKNLIGVLIMEEIFWLEDNGYLLF